MFSSIQGFHSVTTMSNTECQTLETFHSEVLFSFALILTKSLANHILDTLINYNTQFDLNLAPAELW